MFMLMQHSLKTFNQPISLGIKLKQSLTKRVRKTCTFTTREQQRRVIFHVKNQLACFLTIHLFNHNKQIWGKYSLRLPLPYC